MMFANYSFSKTLVSRVDLDLIGFQSCEDPVSMISLALYSSVLVWTKGILKVREWQTKLLPLKS